MWFYLINCIKIEILYCFLGMVMVFGVNKKFENIVVGKQNEKHYSFYINIVDEWCVVCSLWGRRR